MVNIHLLLNLLIVYKAFPCLALITQWALRRGEAERKEAAVWTGGASHELNGCFHSTNWDDFKDFCTDLDLLTLTVSGQI